MENTTQDQINDVIAGGQRHGIPVGILDQASLELRKKMDTHLGGTLTAEEFQILADEAASDVASGVIADRLGNSTATSVVDKLNDKKWQNFGMNVGSTFLGCTASLLTVGAAVLFFARRKGTEEVATTTTQANTAANPFDDATALRATERPRRNFKETSVTTH